MGEETRETQDLLHGGLPRRNGGEKEGGINTVQKQARRDGTDFGVLQVYRNMAEIFHWINNFTKPSYLGITEKVLSGINFTNAVKVIIGSICSLIWDKNLPI